MSTIKKVAIIGASGNLGPAITNALVDAGFEVTALTRESSTSTFPSSIAVKKVNYSSRESVENALRGQDAVVSTIATPAVGGQKELVDAAVAAGVKRFIPSEFGINTRTASGPIAQILAGKVATVDHLMKQAEANPGFSWTGIANSLFFDWGLNIGGMGFDPSTKTALIYGSGDEPFCGSNLGFIGKAVAAVLKNPEATANKYLSIAGFTTTQNKILAFIEKQTGEKWAVQKVSTTHLQKSGEEKLAKGDPMAFRDLVRAYTYGDGCGHAFKPEDNAAGMLGLGEDNLEETLMVWMKKKGLLA